jgi:hypothetical protein
MFTLIDSTGPLRRRLSDDPILLSQAPQWAWSKSGHPCHPLDSNRHVCYLGAGREGISLPATDCPIRQGLETGGPFPVGQNPLRVNSPYGPSAKPGVLAACLAPHRYLSGACCSREQSVLSRLAPTAHRLPVQAMGFSIHSISALHGALAGRPTSRPSRDIWKCVASSHASANLVLELIWLC